MKKQSKLAALKALMNGEITLDKLTKTINLVFVGDPKDEPLIEADDYMKRFEPAKKIELKKKKTKVKAEIEPLESPVLRPHGEPDMVVKFGSNGSMIFSTNPDNYADLKKSLEQDIAKYIN